MSVTISTDVFCDKCNNWEDGVTGITIKIRAARAVAKKLGWKRYWFEDENKWIDLCPVCARDYEASLAQGLDWSLEESEEDQ